MVFCRGCGKQIHESAISCPQCGAVQTPNHRNSNLTKTNDNGTWQSVVSICLGIVSFVTIAETNKLDHDQFIGVIIFCVTGAIFGGVGFAKNNGNKVAPVVGLICCALAFLATIGQSF